ncbi:MAG TPA: hypothetical protein VFL81_02035 [Candidatus Saccharimonadales bacterium]|nr:hypothetical protein [Candidatus Saccharimonadales bacterium]
MINLLSSEHKRNLRAARVNVVLRRYVNLILLVAIIAALIFAAGYLLTRRERSQAAAAISENQSQIAQYDKVRHQAEQFETNLKSARVILSGQVTFSQLIVDIAKTLPAGTVLESLHIETQDIGGKPITLSARTVDSAVTPLKLKSALEASPLFSNVSIISIKRDTNLDNQTQPTSQSAYPVSVSLSVSLTKTAGKPGGQS